LLVPCGGGREKDSRSVQRPAGAGEFLRDGRLQQVVAGSLQYLRRQPAGLVLAEGVRDQAEGVLGLPVGQQVRPVLPVRDHAQPPLVVSGQADQGLVHAGQVGRPVIGQGQAHPGQQGAHRQLPPAHPGRQHCLDPRRDAGGVDDRLEHCQRDHGRRAAPSSRTASASPTGSSPATRSPSRWEQVIPAACMNVASPSSCAQSAS
jgi:hypothetical protein